MLVATGKQQHTSPGALTGSLVPQAHIYSLGATLKAALEYVAEPEPEPRLSHDLEALLDQMQAEDPGDRPDLEVTLGPSPHFTQRLSPNTSMQPVALEPHACTLTNAHTHTHARHTHAGPSPLPPPSPHHAGSSPGLGGIALGFSKNLAFCLGLYGSVGGGPMH